MRRVRKDDRVKVITGKDRGKEGRIVKVLIDRDRVLVEGVNYVKKHQRLQQTATGVQEGGIIETEAPIHISNVMPICPSCGEATRVGYVRTDEQDKLTKARSCKSCDATF
jgi:large subunit ribosomal protein L24